MGLSISISVPKLKLFQREKVTLQMHESAVVDPPKNPETSTCIFIFLFEPKLVVSAIPTGFRAGLFGPA